MVDGGRLAEVNPARVGPGIEPADPGDAQDSRTRADPKVGSVPEGRRLGP